MNRKAILILAIVLLALIILISFWAMTRQREFDLAAYANYIEQYPCDIIGEPVHKSTEAKVSAKKVWATIYGPEYENLTKVLVYYDAINRAWLAHGNTAPTLIEGHLIIGGAPYIIIEEDSGRVIAVWHTK